MYIYIYIYGYIYIYIYIYIYVYMCVCVAHISKKHLFPSCLMFSGKAGLSLLFPLFFSAFFPSGLFPPFFSGGQDNVDFWELDHCGRWSWSLPGGGDESREVLGARCPSKWCPEVSSGFLFSVGRFGSPKIHRKKSGSQLILASLLEDWGWFPCSCLFFKGAKNVAKKPVWCKSC